MSRNLKGGLAAALALAVVAVLPALASDDGSVVVTKPGVVFHKAGSSDIRGKAVDKTIDAALESGYSPCPTCFAKELAARGTRDGIKGGASMATSAAGDGVPVPPVSTVSQPFGVRYSSRPSPHSDQAVKDPYAQTFTYIPGRHEQGAYGER